MNWGLFNQPDSVHVAPTDADGFLLDGHVLAPTCECKPRPQREPDWVRTKWVHHDGQ